MLSSLKVFNTESLVELFELENAGEVGLVQNLIDSFKRDGVPLIDKLYACEKKRDTLAFEHAAHSLKSSSGLLGLERVAFLAAAIEHEARDKRMSLDQLPELRREVAAALAELEAFLTLKRSGRVA